MNVYGLLWCVVYTSYTGRTLQLELLCCSREQCVQSGDLLINDQQPAHMLHLWRMCIIPHNDAISFLRAVNPRKQHFSVYVYMLYTPSATGLYQRPMGQPAQLKHCQLATLAGQCALGVQVATVVSVSMVNRWACLGLQGMCIATLCASSFVH